MLLLNYYLLTVYEKNVNLIKWLKLLLISLEFSVYEWGLRHHSLLKLLRKKVANYLKVFANSSKLRFESDKWNCSKHWQHPSKYFNVVVRVIWRRDVTQRQIDVETMLCFSTLKFTTLKDVESVVWTIVC